MSLTVTIILTLQLFLTLQWTKEDGHRTSTSAVPNLFVPLNTNPKEVQEMRNKVRPAVGTAWERGCGIGRDARCCRVLGVLASNRGHVLPPLMEPVIFFTLPLLFTNSVKC
jgi:hypothetical protein